MSLTRAELDRKITELTARVQSVAPRAVARRCLETHVLDYTIGGILTLLGGWMAWRLYRSSQYPASMSTTFSSG